MDTINENTFEQSNNSVNVSYAEALTKGKNVSNNLSNNNPTFYESINGNISIPKAREMLKEDSSFIKGSDSFNESFEDAIDSQEFKFSEDTSDSIDDSQLNSNVSAASNIEVQNASKGVQSHELNFTENNLSDSEENTSESNIVEVSLKWKVKPSNPQENLPETVTVLQGENGAMIYVVGTAHFSIESQEDVSKTIRAVQPDIVMLELCKTRINILALDEKYVLEEAGSMNLQKIRSAIEQNGFLQGMLYCLLLSMSAHLVRELGLPPGGEFKRAYNEAQQIPGCIVHLGDRPIHVTLQRALATLSAWQKVKIAWHMLRCKEPMTIEDVERCKQKDILEEMIAEMTGEYPELSKVFVNERDTYLAYSLQIAAQSNRNPHLCGYPHRVVGVVGIGHVPGIIQKWGKVKEEDVIPIMHIPEPSLSSRMVRATIRVTLCCAVLYGAYKVFPRSLIPNKLKSAFQNIPNSGFIKIFSK